MFDIGGWEFLVIVIIALVVIGPKDLPAAIRNISGWVRKARELAREFQSGLSEIARETELDSVQRDIRQGLGLDEGEDIGNRIRREVEESVDPDGAIRDSLEDDDFLGDPLFDPYAEDPEQDEIERAKAIAAERPEGGDAPPAAERDEPTPDKPAAPARGSGE